MYRGHYCDAAVQMVQSNVGYGAMTGATPNGRLAGMPLSDTMSATQQADTHGPTAAARAWAKAKASRISDLAVPRATIRWDKLIISYGTSRLGVE